MECSFCKKICKNGNSLRNHERLCNKNPNKQIIVSNFIVYHKKIKEGNIKGSNQYIKAKKLGLPKPIITEETKLKLSKTSKGRKYDDEYKKRHSISMKKAVQKYPGSYTKNNVVGRVKNIEYKGVKLKGSWELIFVKWLDDNGIQWEHETKSFQYEWNGIRTYYPDFYLTDLDLYVEVKGFERERDRAKWSVVPRMIVIKSNNIKEIKNGVFDLSKIPIFVS
jgi:hypothetical protein